MERIILTEKEKTHLVKELIARYLVAPSGSVRQFAIYELLCNLCKDSERVSA